MTYQTRTLSVGLFIRYILSLQWLFPGNTSHSVPPSPQPTKDEIQEAKNRETIGRLFAGNYTPIAPAFLPVLNELFARWQKFQKNMVGSASRQSLRELKKMLQDPWTNPYKAKIVSRLPEDMSGYTSFINNAFTEPFPSTNDMDTWSLVCLVKTIMACHNISVEESEKYLFHAEMHFVNHDMLSGIICVAVYVRK